MAFCLGALQSQYHDYEIFTHGKMVVDGLTKPLIGQKFLQFAKFFSLILLPLV